MDMTKFKRYVELVKQKAEIDANIDAIKYEMSELEPYIQDQMIEAGIQNIKVDDRTIYLNRQIWASPSQGQEPLCEYLRENGFDDLITTSIASQRLSAMVREYPPDEQGLPDLPDELKALVKVSETIKVKVKK